LRTYRAEKENEIWEQLYYRQFEKRWESGSSWLGFNLREVTVTIGLKNIDIQEEIIVKALLDSSVTGLVIS